MELEGFKKRVLKELHKMDLSEHIIMGWKYFESLGPCLKDNSLSIKTKEEGNKLYIKSDLNSAQQHNILHLYNQSIANAPLKSEELAKAYSNKCALLLRMRRYKECISESKRAMKITKTCSLKVKLLCREATCLTALGSSDNRCRLEKARFIFTKLEDTKDKEILVKIIEKTQGIIDENKLDIPKEVRRRVEALKMVEESKKINILSSVKLAYSKEYGKHLVAARNFEPGEVIMIEKPYRIHLDVSKGSQYCYHCFKYLWTAVPCHQCAMRMFCSKQCKAEAWAEYHDMECTIIAHMRRSLHMDTFNPIFPVIMSIFFKALKEAGSIQNLKSEIEYLDKNQGQHSDGFPANTDFMSYKNVYTLPVRGLNEAQIQLCAETSLNAVVGLARYTKLLGKTYEVRELKGLIKNETALFVGAIVTKFGMIVSRGCVRTKLPDPAETDVWTAEILDKNFSDEVTCSRPLNGIVKLSTFLTPISCLPTVAICSTSGLEFIMHALQPIKAGTMLTASDTSLYNSTPDSVRQSMYQRLYNRPCKCQACTEKWSKLFEDISVFDGKIVTLQEGMLFERLQNDFRCIVTEYESRHHRQNYPDSKVLANIKTLAKETWEHYGMPHPLTYNAVGFLALFFRLFHSPVKSL